MDTEGSGMRGLRKPLLLEDTVEYRLYPEECSSSLLASLALEWTSFSRSFAAGHIWHYEPFRLAAWEEDNAGVHPPHIFGSTCFRDNIEDEWLIVRLLFALSQSYPGVIISVTDSDGEFLLIEAAHHIPKWLKPETAENRVFISSGRLHIIPKPRSPAEVPLLPVATPTLREALVLVRGHAPTDASPAAQRDIVRRTSRFPDSLGDRLHRTHCFLPHPLSQMMSCDSQLVAAAVHILCDRDPADMKVCRTMERFSPRKYDFVMTEVLFTRCLYAKLLHEHFAPPRNLGFRLPPASNPQHKFYDLGMKLTCGFEMLVSRAGGSAGWEEGTGEGVERDSRWQAFLKSLKEKDYFQGQVEGSVRHQELVAAAKEFFSNSMALSAADQGEGGHVRSDVLSTAGKRACHLLKGILDSVALSKSDPEKDLLPPDDDSWLEISAEQLEEMLQNAAGLPVKKPSSDHGLEAMATGMKAFVDKVSSYQGAEFPSASAEEAVHFDPEGFVQTLQDMLGRHPQSRGEEEEEDESEEDFSLSSDSGSTSSKEEDEKEEEEEEEAIAAAMYGMDQELATTEVGKSFEKLSTEVSSDHDEATAASLPSGLQPVDVDFNLVKNLLESYTAQGGVAGPASNILRSMGVHIPTESANKKTGEP